MLALYLKKKWLRVDKYLTAFSTNELLCLCLFNSQNPTFIKIVNCRGGDEVGVGRINGTVLRLKTEMRLRAKAQRWFHIAKKCMHIMHFLKEKQKNWPQTHNTTNYQTKKYLKKNWVKTKFGIWEWQKGPKTFF